MTFRTRLALVTALTASTAAFAVPGVSTAADEGHQVTQGCLTSVPDPGTTADVKICYTLFKPKGASASNQVPMLLHSHGWGGTRTDNLNSLPFGERNGVHPFVQAGYGVLSFDQRGFGESGGFAHVENPDAEGYDVRKLVDLVSTLDWVKKDGPGDPRLGAVGGSYGGGYQFLGAFELLRLKGKPVFDALAPEITWNDVRTSLAPAGVPRTEWATALAAAALPSTALAPNIYKALLEAAATGSWPDGSLPGGEDLETFFAKNGPAWHVSQGRKLDIPVLFGQGMTDTLFNLGEGLRNWHTALTPSARKRSMFVGYNGGHVLPGVLPQSVSVTSDPCSTKLGGGTFRDLSIRFFDEKLKGKPSTLKGYGQFHLATAYSSCTTVSTVAADRTVPLGTVATTAGVGAPIAYEVAKGPLRLAGTPLLTGSLTTLTPDSRAFYGLAIGTSPLDAKLVQGNVMPIRVPNAVSGQSRRIELPSVAVDVQPHQKLFLLVTPISDMFAGMGSRIPGTVVLRDAKVELPVVD